LFTGRRGDDRLDIPSLAICEHLSAYVLFAASLRKSGLSHQAQRPDFLSEPCCAKKKNHSIPDLSCQDNPEKSMPFVHHRDRRANTVTPKGAKKIIHPHTRITRDGNGLSPFLSFAQRHYFPLLLQCTTITTIV
jgi:hypothetical protein